MNYKTYSASLARLQLWVDHSIERRTERAHGQILAGEAESQEFNIKPSQVLINFQNPPPDIIGTNRFLVHKTSNSIFKLDAEKLSLIKMLRSFRRADRRHSDLEWDLTRFFEMILRNQYSEYDIGILICDFNTMVGKMANYKISLDAQSIEESQ